MNPSSLGGGIRKAPLSSHPRVLLPSDDFDWLANFADGYQAIGFDVAAGRVNCRIEGGDYDVVHLLWPEEFANWQVPTAAEVDVILRKLDRWARNSRLIISVSNLYPHRHPNEQVFRRLYTGFYERAEVIHHFSNKSKELVLREYPSISTRNHIVRLGFNYERLLPQYPRDRRAARQKYGLSEDDVVYLAFGALRFWEEVKLLQREFTAARVPNKRLLLSARYAGDGSAWLQRYRRWVWRRWQARKGITSIQHRIADSEMPILFDACDAIVVVRQNVSVMTSGLPNLAMTLGRFLIAPNLGGTPEYVTGTDNIIYDQSSPGALASAMELASTIDRERVGAQNARIAAGWGWASIIKACIDALP
jgi:hypothetical protein